MARFVLKGAGMYGHHDAYAQYVFERPENAEALLRFALPEGFVERADWGTLRLERSTFTHPSLRAALGGLLYSLRLKDTGQSVMVLLEHQSEEAWDMAERLQKYEARQRATWRRRNPNAREVPAVLGVVLYHGLEPWRAPRRLEGLLGLVLEELERQGWLGLVRNPEYLLVELRNYGEEELLALEAPPLARLALVLLRFGRTGQLREKLLKWVPLFQEVYATPTGAEDLEATVSYVRELGDERTDAVLKQVLSSLMPDKRAEELMETVGQKLREEGRLQGRVEGKIEGRAQSLLELLAARAIAVDEATRQRIMSCTDLDLLALWFSRALHATSLAEVLREWMQ